MKTTLLTIQRSFVSAVFIALIIFISAATKTQAQGQCYAYFTYTVDTTTPGVTVINFDDTAYATIGSIISYHWYLNGVSMSTGQHPSHTFTNPFASNQVCLTITTDSGCTNTYCDSIQISGISCNGQAGYSYTHDSLGNYTFAGYASGMTPPLTYVWHVSNGNTYTGPSLSILLNVFTSSSFRV